MLGIDNLEFSFGCSRVLEEISLEVEKGRILAVLGPNGSGKTTLIRCILQILAPTAGSVRVDGRPAREMSRKELARCLGYVAQSVPAMLPMSVFDTVLMGRSPHLRWNPGDSDLQCVAGVLEATGLGHLAFRSMDQISGGQAQKVLLARALVQDAGYLLLDEPTSSLDLRHQLEILDMIQEYTRSGRIGVLLALHDLNLAARYAHRIVMLRQGRIFCSGTPREVLTPETLEEVFGVESEVLLEKGNLIIYPLQCSPQASRPAKGEKGKEGMADS